MTFHRFLLLEIERTLLSIRPEFKALPYWDMALDSAIGGKYAMSDEDSIFSPKFFGSYTGNPSENYAVTDGSFAYWPVSQFNSTEYAPYADVYNGSETTGFNRKYTNPSNVSFVARFDKSGYSNPDPIMLLEANTNICANYAFIKTWEQWQNCVEIDVASKNANPPYGIYSVQGTQTTVPWFHAQAHLKIGSLQLATGFMGDFMDVTTSINDPIFLFHHTNIDRNNMKWQMDAEAQNATLADDNVLWDFPIVLPNSNISSTGFPVNLGCWLQDSEVSYRFPFTPLEVFGPGAELECPGSAVNGTYTHKDILRLSKPGQSTNVYDTNM
ncbi:hypothetical protein SARC_11183 [Sphaeroforma arctica JP610]|uniref:Tyrosinase copper-binding domain-containing protein n=1 Tax=Sphaeroforma arctica JP610 TaxID=667725 RepID=A0A0L0FIJ4_9EUKA|nr:hypothetical protein SARC_11183 [Sphaeroforma arctica JP610]KNC76306.1 hypothetical protein SARC_11183 [Sphaeroforma arctica JP610]|eukprot:XP_014150208.1 hypothetical protein SARC_11183 [Sphaeroforma arctica JP610]